MSRPTIVLIGPPGSGKSTVARLLGDRLGLPLLDTDSQLAERTGQPLSELFVDVGENEFRRLEGVVVGEALNSPGVVALGSGAVVSAAEELAACRAAGAAVVFLDVSLAVGVPRAGLNVPRAVTLGSPRAAFAAMVKERRPLYLAAAGMVVDTSERTAAEVVEAILEHVQVAAVGHDAGTSGGDDPDQRAADRGQGGAR